MEREYLVVVYTAKKEYYKVFAEDKEDAEWNYVTKGKKTSEKIHEENVDVYERNKQLRSETDGKNCNKI